MEEALRSFGRPCTSQEFLKKFPGYSVSELQGSGDVYDLVFLIFISIHK